MSRCFPTQNLREFAELTNIRGGVTQLFPIKADVIVQRHGEDEYCISLCMLYYWQQASWFRPVDTNSTITCRKP